MKKLLVLLAFASQTVFAATNASKATVRALAQNSAQNPAIITTRETPMNALNSPARNLFITTNIVDLSKGNGNVDAHFLITESAAFSFNYITTSQSEIVPEINPTNKVKVDRRAYGVGGAWFLRPLATSKTTFLINPTIQFGQKSDLINVTNQNGVRFKISAIHKPAPNFALEAGIRADNLDETFKGEAVVGLGFIL